jgi:hypothetical protein
VDRGHEDHERDDHDAPAFEVEDVEGNGVKVE